MNLKRPSYFPTNFVRKPFIFLKDLAALIYFSLLRNFSKHSEDLTGQILPRPGQILPQWDGKSESGESTLIGRKDESGESTPIGRNR